VNLAGGLQLPPKFVTGVKKKKFSMLKSLQTVQVANQQVRFMEGGMV